MYYIYTRFFENIIHRITRLSTFFCEYINDLSTIMEFDNLGVISKTDMTGVKKKLWYLTKIASKQKNYHPGSITSKKRSFDSIINFLYKHL